MTRRLVQHSAFVALCSLRIGTGDVGGGPGPSSNSIESSGGRLEREAYEPHRCQSCGSICFLPIEGAGHDNFMEEVSILMFCVFIIDYIYIYLCVCVFYDVYF